MKNSLDSTSLSAQTGQDTHSNVREELAAQADQMRAAVYELAAYGLTLGAISREDAAELTRMDTSTEEGLKNLQKFVRDGISTQKRAYDQVYADFTGMMREAEEVLSVTSLNEWSMRFQNTNFSEKRYFLTHQFRGFIDNWKEIHRKRDELETKARMFLSTQDVPKLSTFLSGFLFKELRYREKKDLVAQVEAALAAQESNQKKALFAEARSALDAAVEEGILSPQKVGGWLKRIFDVGASQAEIEQFVRGKGKNSLHWCKGNWRQVRGDFDAVMGDLKKSEYAARGFKRIAQEAFLRMDYDQRVSYIAEARRTLSTSLDTDNEEPILLRIRHALDIEDWHEADAAIREASGMNLDTSDKSRLASMKQYLRQHRREAPVPKAGPSPAEIDAANRGIEEALARMDPSMRAIAIGLLPFGNNGINNLRWIVYNYLWCKKNGYLDEDEIQREFHEHEEETIERVKRQEDVGRHDVVTTGHIDLFRRDGHVQNSKKKATFQYVDISEDSVKDRLVARLPGRDPKMLYWETFVGCKGDQTMSADWHASQLECLNELRRCTRILDGAGKKARIAGGESSARQADISYATPA